MQTAIFEGILIVMLYVYIMINISV